ncbi:hypothetical protein SAMN05216337_104239 [Bradyrhizobium brasilense]|uniref:SnoaL-like domain-containing protein n=1 Tax=Bradyrhizobium brasilense TaxID=1419277 RepID=A0A1G7HLX7_9BRAD|nr:hypothetical protein SAMN05216337_104239 [Bradyrhizobium brasilense]
MRSLALVIAFTIASMVPASAQKAEIEATNVKLIEFFNKGDFAGIASLYSPDATALPPGSGVVRGSNGHRGNVERHGGTGWRSETDDR